MRKFVMGDIHGCYKGLLQCLERSRFNKEKDILIQVGDVADGWSQVYECVEELLTIENLISIKGNHDDWFLDFILYHKHGYNWQQGGIGTLKSYTNVLDKNYINKNSGGFLTDLLPEDLPLTHIDFFKKQLLYYKDEDNNFFVHGGFNRHHEISDIEKLEPYTFYWDRDLWNAAQSYQSMINGYTGDMPIPKFKIKDDFKEIFIGHTTTMSWNTDKPMKAANIWNLDTGAGFKGKLTIMNIDTKEFFQSDEVQTLYLNERGRN